MKHFFILVLGLILLPFIIFSENPDPSKYEAKYYENAKVIRIQYTSGEAFVQRSYDEGMEEATLNLPVFEKDKVGTTNGRLELYLGRLNYLRLDNDTEITFSEIPVLRKTNMTLRILKGGIYLDTANIDNEKDMEIQTPDCGIFLLDRGLYRINVNEAGYTEVYVYEGMAEVAGNDSSRNVQANQKIVMSDGTVKERPFYFNSSDQDDFDRWNEERNRTIGHSRQSASRYLESGYEDCEYELSRTGRWIYENAYTTYVWIPYNIGHDWRPYWHGRWIWNPFYGYVWNSYDPWGWYTHHYGRWHWSPYYGWYWIPGYHWSPAWISWFWDSYYYGWCPLSYWNRPIIIFHKKWHHKHPYWKGIPLHASSATFIRKNQLSASRIDRIALTSGELAKVTQRNLDFRGGAPKDQLIHNRVTITDARGRTVQYKQGGILSSSKNRLDRNSLVNKSQSRTEAFKYSRSPNSSGQPFQYTGSVQRERSAYQSSSSKSYYPTRFKSTDRPVYRSTTKPDSWSSKSYRNYSSPSTKNSTSGKSATKRKKDQPYFNSRASSSSQSKSYISSNSNAVSSRYARPQYSPYSNSARTYAQKTYKSFRSQNTDRNGISPYSENRNQTYRRDTETRYPSYRSTYRNYSSPDYSNSNTRAYPSYRSPGYSSTPYHSSSRSPYRSSDQNSFRSPGSSSYRNYNQTPSHSYRPSSPSSHYSRPSSPSRSSYSPSRGSASQSHQSRSSSSSPGRKRD